MTDPAPHEAIAEIELRLLPCPFCGPGGSIVEIGEDPRDKFRVYCGRCGVTSGFRVDNDREKLIQHWNTRHHASRDAEIARLTGELARMKERCAKVCDEDYAHRLRQAQLALDDHTPIFSKKQLLESKAMVSFGLATAIRALPTGGDG